MSANRNIGVLLSASPHEGGSYQWTMNILEVLQDFSKTRGNTKIHVFNYPSYSVLVQSEFPNFVFHRIHTLPTLMSSVVRKIFVMVPGSIGIIKHIFPLNWILAKRNIDLMVFPTTTIDSSFCKTKHIFFHADISHVFYPDFPEVSANGVLRHRHILFKYGLRNADQIIAESEQLRNDIAKYYGADPSKTDVVYQILPQALLKYDIVEDDETIDFRLQLPDKYIFYPAQLWEHKNHKNLLFALDLLRAEFPDLCLVLTGSRQKGDERIFSLIEELGLKGHVKYFGYVQDKFMRTLYQRAQALVMPTYFGPTNIPTLEAFYYGCPAVISDLPGVTEQTGEAAIRFDPSSPKDIARKVRSVLTDNELRNRMIAEGYERLKLLSYENYRDALFAVLDKGLNRNQEASSRTTQHP
jgi:glycosyltransferase involved in cell wall biosynthesis